MNVSTVVYFMLLGHTLDHSIEWQGLEGCLSLSALHVAATPQGVGAQFVHGPPHCVSHIWSTLICQ